MKSIKFPLALLVIGIFLAPILVMARTSSEQLAINPVSYWQANNSHIYSVNTGNVGIGTTNPQAKLDVFGGVRIRQGLDVGYQDTITAINMAGGSFELGSSILSYPSHLSFFNSNNTFTFSSSNSVMPVLVGIGNFGGLSPQANLHIKATNNTEGLKIVSSNHSPLIVRNSSDSSDLFRIKENGNVGIGTNAPSAKLEVNGAIKASDYLASNGQAGLSASFALKSANGSDCLMNFNNGLLTSSTCESLASQKINYSR